MDVWPLHPLPTKAQRSSPRLRWPDGLHGVTAKAEQDLVTVTVNGDSRIGLNFGAEGKTFPVVESIEPNSLMAVQCPEVVHGMVCSPAHVLPRVATDSAQHAPYYMRRILSVIPKAFHRVGSIARNLLKTGVFAPAQIVKVVEGAQAGPVDVEGMTADQAAQVFLAAGRPVTVTLRRP